MRHWIADAIVYQVNLRAFAAREPRNPVEAARERPQPLSPLAFLAQNLSTIRKLGANVVYLMPPYPMGIEGRKGIGSPYSIRDFRAVDPEHGTIEELAAVVRRAHELGLKVILDITPNHTSRDHTWMTSHPEFYVRDNHGNIFHDADWTDTAKLDYTRSALRHEMTEVYDFWLGFLGRDAAGQPDGVDGFRLDMAHFINDRTFWNEAIATLRARHPARELLFLAECYGTRNNLDLFARGINAAYDDDFYKVCGYLYAVDESGASVVSLSPDAESNADFRDKLDAFKAGGIAGAMERALLSYEQALPPGGDGPFLARYTDNHDEGRGTYRFGAGAVRAVNGLIALCPHSLPFLLCGQEFGALNRPPIHERIGPCDKGRRVVAEDRARTDAGVEFEGNLFARGAAERAAWHGFYRDLFRLRLKNPALTQGAFSLIDAGEVCAAPERAVIAFERRWKRVTLRCAVNLGPAPRELRNAASFAGRILYGGLQTASLPPFSAIVARV